MSNILEDVEMRLDESNDCVVVDFDWVIEFWCLEVCSKWLLIDEVFIVDILLLYILVRIVFDCEKFVVFVCMIDWVIGWFIFGVVVYVVKLLFCTLFV